MPARRSSRWLTIVLAVGLVAATSALTLALVSRQRSAPGATIATSQAPSVASIAETPTIAKPSEAIAVDAAAPVAGPVATTIHSAHPKASASAPGPATTKHAPTPDHGGVVETVPY